MKITKDNFKCIEPNYKSLTLNTIEDVVSGFIKPLSLVFELGKGKSGTELKKYTGPSLESLNEFAIKLCCEALKLDFKIDSEYIKDPSEVFDDLRLDQHLRIGNNPKYVMMGESRAWQDKPFTSLKFGVIRDILTLSHAKQKTISDVIFPIMCYSFDVTEKTLRTQNHQLNRYLKAEGIPEHTSYGSERIKMFSLTGKSRSSEGNYFDKGFNRDNVKEYITFVYNHLKLYSEGKLV